MATWYTPTSMLQPIDQRAPQRIVSLLPSATEIICALGAMDDLVGISHECDFPESIRDRPVLTRSRIDPSGSSRAIDAAVREVIRDALSIYSVDEERVGDLRRRHRHSGSRRGLRRVARRQKHGLQIHKCGLMIRP